MTTTKKAAKEAIGFDAMAAMNPEAFKEGYEKFAEGVSSLAEFQKSSLEAMMTSAGAFAKGFEKLASEQTAFIKSSFEESVATAKAASASKTTQDMVDVNSEFLREAVEKNLSQLNKIADMWAETAKETVEPLTERYSDLVEKIQAYRP